MNPSRHPPGPPRCSAGRAGPGPRCPYATTRTHPLGTSRRVRDARIRPSRGSVGVSVAGPCRSSLLAWGRAADPHLRLAPRAVLPPGGAARRPGRLPRPPRRGVPRRAVDAVLVVRRHLRPRHARPRDRRAALGVGRADHRHRRPGHPVQRQPRLGDPARLRRRACSSAPACTSARRRRGSAGRSLVDGVDVYPLPYLEPALVADALGAEERTHAGGAAGRHGLGARRSRRARGTRPAVVMAHAFVAGGLTSDSERDISAGGVGGRPARGVRRRRPTSPWATSTDRRRSPRPSRYSGLAGGDVLQRGRPRQGLVARRHRHVGDHRRAGPGPGRATAGAPPRRPRDPPQRPAARRGRARLVPGDPHRPRPPGRGHGPVAPPVPARPRARLRPRRAFPPRSARMPPGPPGSAPTSTSAATSSPTCAAGGCPPPRSGSCSSPPSTAPGVDRATGDGEGVADAAAAATGAGTEGAA